MLPLPSVGASPSPESLGIVHATYLEIQVDCYKALLPTALSYAVLGQFLPQLCRYCADVHGMDHTLDEFFIYEFAKV